MSTSQNSSLYVGDLHQDVTEALLYEVFRDIGAILSIKVCRDTNTTKSLGYAYVNFQNAQDAAKAIDHLNFTEVKGKPIRIMYVQRDPASRKSGLGNIFIKNLDKSIDNKLLYDTFSNVGHITSCKVCTKKVEKVENGKTSFDEEPLGYGFVHFDSHESAKLAIQKVNGMAIAGKIVTVAPFIRKQEREKTTSGSLFTNIYIKDLDSKVTEVKLKEIFSKFGDITSLYLNPNTTQATNFAFLNFMTTEQAQEAVTKMNGVQLDGVSAPNKTLYVSKAEKKEVRRQKLREEYEKKKQATHGLNVYVKNLDESIDTEKLKSIFGQYGKISSAIVMLDSETNTSRCFGFICYENQDDAGKAITDLHQKIVGTKPLYVSLAQRKENRRIDLEIQHQQRQRNNQYFQGIQMGQGNQRLYGQNQMTNPSWINGKGKGQNQNQNQVQNQGQNQGQNQSIGKKDRKDKKVGGGKPNPKPTGSDIKYNPNVRNKQQPQTQTKPKQTVSIDQDTFNASHLASLSPRSQKQTLGEHLYPMVSLAQPELASKITGMLLEMDNGDILNLLETPNALNAKITEALNVLQVHKNQEKK